MQGYLYPSGLYAPENLLITKLGKPVYTKILAALTLTYCAPVGPLITTKLFNIVTIAGKRCIRLPRGMISLLRNYFPVTVVLAPIRNIDVPKPTLYENQEILCNEIAKNFTPERIQAGTATCVLDLEPGMGKTFVAAGIIYRTQLSTLYVTLRKPLVAQCVNDLCKVFGPGSAVAWNKKKYPVEQPKIAVVVINTAIKIPQEIIKQYSLIILDEIHTYCSASRREIFAKCAPAVFGMTGTIGERTDGLDPVYYAELTPSVKKSKVIVAEDVPGFTYGDVVFNGTVTAVRYHGPAKYTRTLRHTSTGKMFCPYMNEQFLSDPYRMKIATDYILELYNWKDEDRQHVIFVLCEERDPLPLLEAELNRLLGFDVFVPDIGVFQGGITDEKINMMPTSRVILTTYGYASTGISINAATAMVLLTSRKAGRQLVGRILRRGGDLTIHRRIIDIIDEKTPIRRHHEIRALAYAHCGLPIEDVKISWKDIKIAEV